MRHFIGGYCIGAALHVLVNEYKHPWNKLPLSGFGEGFKAGILDAVAAQPVACLIGLAAWCLLP